MDGNTGFDAVLRSALLDAARADYGDILAAAEALPEPAFSEKYLKFRQRLLNEPFAKGGQPFWKKALRMAACILLALGLAGILVWSNPTTRAWVERYLLLRFEDRDEYWFRGNGTMQDLGGIKPAYVPEGFALMSEEVLGKNQFFIYENDSGEEIWFYILAGSNGGLIFDNEHSVRSEILIDGMSGYLYTTSSDEYFNHLILFEEESGCAYYFASSVGVKELIRMAESLENRG